ncbi:MAG: galactokinase [Chloroflexi bacterium]|nr:galactokinase [Chloroflexota bacterium]
MGGCRVEAERAFAHRYGREPDAVVRAPGRVNLIGEHTDYNDGFVLPMSIDRGVCIALRYRADGLVRVHSLDFDETAQFSLHDFERGQGWIEYIKGVVWALQSVGCKLTGWEGALAGNVPVGSGLSSSAALELAAARAFALVSDAAWAPMEAARLCQRAENEWVGVQCGIMDQLVSALGREKHALLIDCRTLDIDPIPMPDSVRIVVLDSAAPRTLAGSAYNERRSQCESAMRKLQAAYPHIQALRDVSPAMLVAEAKRLDEVERKRARHVINENVRVLSAARALREGDMTRLGELMVESHESLRTDYEVSSPALDALVELALQTPGVLGARLTGAGFGGCVIALARTSYAEDAAQSIIAQYRQRTGLPGSAFVTRAAPGAEVVSGAGSFAAHVIK